MEIDRMAEKEGPQVVTDVELIQKITSGDHSAFSILYERYFRRVYAFVDKRMRNRADTEEVVQEVFINVFSSLESFRSEGPFAAWVLGVARRTAANRFKKKQLPTVSFEEDEDLDSKARSGGHAATPLENYECQEELRLLQTAVEEKLSKTQRRLFELHHLGHRTIHDIANITNKSEDSVKSNLYRARRLLLAR
jgi:RNA polymerase sigma-70 factor (ECF subfamily)